MFLPEKRLPDIQLRLKLKLLKLTATEIKAAKELFYNNKFIEANGDPRKTWQIINDPTSRKAVNSSIREINLNGISISESSDLSNAFNDHFSSIGPKLANDIPLSGNNGHCHQKYVKGIKVPITPKIVFHLKNLSVFVSKMVKELLFLLENSIFYAPSKVTENHRKNSHDRACEGPGSIPGLTSQTVLHAC